MPSMDADGNPIWENSLQPVSEAGVIRNWGRETKSYDHSSNS